MKEMTLTLSSWVSKISDLFLVKFINTSPSGLEVIYSSSKKEKDKEIMLVKV